MVSTVGEVAMGGLCLYKLICVISVDKGTKRTFVIILYICECGIVGVTLPVVIIVIT